MIRVETSILAILLASAISDQLIANAHAQTSGSSTSQSGVLAVAEQIEVIATRLPEAPHDVPASVEVINGDMLRAIGATTVREALAMATGVEVGPGGDAGPAFGGARVLGTSRARCLLARR
jgi:outer membrane receptor protein involved in Fe transport